MTKQEFETLYGKEVSMAEYEIINAMYMRHDNESETRTDLGKVRIELAEAQQKLHDFAAMVAVETHQYDKTATIAACVETLGLAGYYRALLNAGCTPTQEDLKMFVATLDATNTENQ